MMANVFEEPSQSPHRAMLLRPSSVWDETKRVFRVFRVFQVFHGEVRRETTDRHTDIQIANKPALRLIVLYDGSTGVRACISSQAEPNMQRRALANASRTSW